jgi:hypothetical protein
MALQTLIVEELPPPDTSESLAILQYGEPTKYLVQYACATDAASETVPKYLLFEYWRLHHLS